MLVQAAVWAPLRVHPMRLMFVPGAQSLLPGLVVRVQVRALALVLRLLVLAQGEPGGGPAVIGGREEGQALRVFPGSAARLL